MFFTGAGFGLSLMDHTDSRALSFNIAFNMEWMRMEDKVDLTIDLRHLDRMKDSKLQMQLSFYYNNLEIKDYLYT